MIYSALRWLFSEHSIGLASWGLVFATALLVADGWRKSREQKNRWAREDLLYKEAAKPRAVVELGKRTTSRHVVALCYNLGEHPFVIDKVILKVGGYLTKTNDLLGPYVVIPGTLVPITVTCDDLTAPGCEMQFATITLQLMGTTGPALTDPVSFHFYPDPAKVYEWRVGGPEARLPGIVVQQPRMIPDDEYHNALND